ncbi:MAG: helix-hairpin-helix domain-containing protein [Haloarculaceae archaeon]
MSDREPDPERPSPGRFTLEELPRVDAERFEAVERAAIERAVNEREEVIGDLRTELLDVRGERDAYQSRVEQLEGTTQELRDRIRQLETERPSLEPRAVLADFGTAIRDVGDELDVEGAGFTVSQVEVDMKANVVNTEEGMRLHLPSLDEEFAAESLSELRFSVRRQPSREETEYREIPDLRFASLPAAEREIESAGFALGDVDREAATDEAPGTVVEQFPSPYSVAAPGTEIDLVVAEEQPTPEEPEEPPEEPVPEEPATDIPAFETLGEFWTLFGERLEEAGVENPAEFVEREPEETAEILDLDPEAAAALRRRVVALLEAESEGDRIDLQRIDGIGEAFARRLRRAGISDVGALASRDPEEVAEITRVSAARAEEWIERARELLEQG